MTRILVFAILMASGTRAWSADFSGFWKVNCAEPFGIQIAPYQNGMYTVTFCGPGDPHCNAKPDPTTATLIEGDRQYEILGPDKLRIKYSEGYAPVYFKCTPDIHPLLEYSAADQTEEKRNIFLSALFHTLYLIAALAGYRYAHKHTRSLSAIRRRAIRTGIAALLFSPGVFFSWPFAAPSFALLALAVSLAGVPSVGLVQLPAQLLYTVGPIVLVWALLFVGTHFVARTRNGGAQPGAPADGPEKRGPAAEL